MKKPKVSLLLFASLFSVGLLAGCNGKAMKVNEIQPYLFEVETYTELDYDFADSYYATENDNWSGGGCSAITKMVEGDRRLIGRNMDLNISENCAYVVRTNAGKYKTIGLQYTFRDVSPKYAEVKENGISSEWSKLLPFYCDDVMNETGFHIEINMRHGEYYPSGEDVFACKGTNPNGTRRVHMFELPRYIAENCSTVAEAKEYVNTLDVYSKEHYWNYCFILADATGAASLLEFSMDEIYWFDEDKIEEYEFEYLDKADYFGELNYHAIAQTNFYINNVSFYLQDTKSGFGRMQTMQNGIDAVNDKKQMFDLMDMISYSNFYKDYDECKRYHFDPRSEQLGECAGLVSKVVMNDEYEDIIKVLMNEYSEPIRELTREQKRKANEYWESTFTEVVDIKDKSIFVRFYEDSNMQYILDFNGFRKVSHI